MTRVPGSDANGDDGRAEIRVGSVVRFRTVREPGLGCGWIRFLGDADPETVVTIVASHREMGLGKLAPRSALGGALLGRRAGDEVEVRQGGLTITYEVIAVETPEPAAAVSPATDSRSV